MIKDSLVPQNISILTGRETEYLSLVALGYKNLQIANILSVSKSTVKKTLEEIYRRLEAKDRANAVAIAFQHKIITGKTLTEIILRYNIYNY